MTEDFGRKYSEACEAVTDEIKRALTSIDTASLEKLADEILKADQVFFVGVGRVMLALQCVCKRLAHLGMSFFVDNMPKKLQPFMALLSMVCSIIMIALLFKYGADMEVHYRRQYPLDEGYRFRRYAHLYEEVNIFPEKNTLRVLCEGCFYTDFFNGTSQKCQMKASVLELVRVLGKPDVEIQQVLVD